MPIDMNWIETPTNLMYFAILIFAGIEKHNSIEFICGACLIPYNLGLWKCMHDLAEASKRRPWLILFPT